CFPLLDIKSVTMPFQPAAEMLSTRHGQRDGAVGVFVHPGVLAIFSLISSGFFFSCFLLNFKKYYSLLLLVFSAITVVLTYSRTSYLAYIVTLSILYYFYKRTNKTMFSFSIIFRLLLPAFLLLIW